MAAEIITVEDLQVFKTELINDIKDLLKELKGQPNKKSPQAHYKTYVLTARFPTPKLAE